MKSILRPLRRHGRKSDRKRFEWIHTLACAICERFGLVQTTPTEVAHVGVRGAGTKAPDNTAIPLCWVHHSRDSKESVHFNHRAFWERWRLTPGELIKYYQELYEQRMVA